MVRRDDHEGGRERRRDASFPGVGTAPLLRSPAVSCAAPPPSCAPLSVSYATLSLSCACPARSSEDQRPLTRNEIHGLNPARALPRERRESSTQTRQDAKTQKCTNLRFSCAFVSWRLHVDALAGCPAGLLVRGTRSSSRAAQDTGVVQVVILPRPRGLEELSPIDASAAHLISRTPSFHRACNLEKVPR